MKTSGRVLAFSSVVAAAAVLVLSGIHVRWPTPSQAEPYWIESQRTVENPEVDAKSDLGSINYVFTSLAERLSPSVVNVYTKTKVHLPSVPLPEDLFEFFFGNPFGERPPLRDRDALALGSGFVINDKGYIVTNSHVVRQMGRDAYEISVKFLRQERGRGYTAEIVGVDDRTDVALLRLKEMPKTPLTVAPLGNSDLARVGEWVIAIGNPYGHAHTVTQGIVSAIGRNIENVETEFIQTSASINPGNSGGPLFNLYGEVIGINTAIDPRAQGIGFAIPVNTAKAIIGDLIREGYVRRGWLGVVVSPLPQEMQEALGLEEGQGILVRNVIARSPAARAGIKKGDIITKIDNEPAEGPDKLVRKITRMKSGERVALEILRRGKREVIKVQVADEPKGPPGLMPETS